MNRFWIWMIYAPIKQISVITASHYNSSCDLEWCTVCVQTQTWMIPYSFRRSRGAGLTELFLYSSQYHQFYVTFEPLSNYGKVPNSRAQHVGYSEA